MRAGGPNTTGGGCGGEAAAEGGSGRAGGEPRGAGPTLENRRSGKGEIYVIFTWYYVYILYRYIDIIRVDAPNTHTVGTYANMCLVSWYYGGP